MKKLHKETFLIESEYVQESMGIFDPDVNVRCMFYGDCSQFTAIMEPFVDKSVEDKDIESDFAETIAFLRAKALGANEHELQWGFEELTTKFIDYTAVIDDTTTQITYDRWWKVDNEVKSENEVVTQKFTTSVAILDFIKELDDNKMYNLILVGESWSRERYERKIETTKKLFAATQEHDNLYIVMTIDGTDAIDDIVKEQGPEVQMQYNKGLSVIDFYEEDDELYTKTIM